MLAERAPLGTLVPGAVSAPRVVPPAIERPEHMFHPGPETVTASDVKDAETIKRIRTAGRIAADALYEAGKAVTPGVTTDELDRIAHEYMCDHSAYPSCLGYIGFPKSICTSVNEVICHGIPDLTVLKDGNVVNLDVTAYIGGVRGDTNAVSAVGEIDEESRLLVGHTGVVTLRGIEAVKPGREINVIGRVIESYVKRFDYGAVGGYTDHGVGEAFHSGLIVPHYDVAPPHATIMEVGMVSTIEPMLTLGDVAWNQWDDGWTVVARDRGRTVQWEHILAVTEEGAGILTLSSDPELGLRP